MKMVRVVATLVILTSTYGCGTRSPERDQIPILKKRIYQLQMAVKDRNLTAIDSLLSVKIISRKQGSDSMLSFVYGGDGSYPFDRFGNYSIVYTSDKARVDCFIMDSTAQTDRPITFFLAHEHDLWLFTSFQPGLAQPDSAHLR
jgi:hypothetical protein